MGRTGDTLSHLEADRRDVPRPGAALFLEVECDRPLVGPARWHLAGLEQVTLGRGPRRLTRAVPPRRAVIEVPDRWMSSEHLRLVCRNSRWTLTDLGSKNGTLRDGARVDSSELRDGALLQVGQTFFRFRSAFPASGPAVLDCSETPDSLGDLLTLSPTFETTLERARTLAPTAVPILLLGESGTGKEVLARRIHALSGRPGPLVPVNCGAIPGNLVEAELFGHKRGAFSGADRDRPGLVRTSDRGTLFLDEIGDLPGTAQAALLRVLQESEVYPVGGDRAHAVDLRVVAATHHDLQRLVRQGRFRHDLLARLAGMTLELPPLRERMEDLPLLLGTLLRDLAPARSNVRFSPAAANALLTHPWPLNVRELRQTLSAALALSGNGRIEVAHLPRSVVDRPPVEATRELTPEHAKRREELVRLLREHDGNVAAVARALGKARTQVVRWVSRYGIDPGEFGSE